MRVGVVGNPRYDEIRGLLARMADLAVSHQFSLLSEPDLADLWPESVTELNFSRPEIDVLVAFGGDGTLLRGARLLGLRAIPILGVNIGRVGFLAAATPHTLEQAVGALVSGAYSVEPRCALQSQIAGKNGVKHRGALALNDVVVHKAGVARVVRLSVWVDDEAVGQYSADGIIVSTPTGSTAYTMSAGGPVVMPGVDALVVTAICPHTLAVRPLVVPGSAVIAVQLAPPWRDEVQVSYDGQVEATLHPGDRMEIKRAATPVPLVRFGEKRYFEAVRAKLQWGDLADRENG